MSTLAAQLFGNGNGGQADTAQHAAPNGAAPAQPADPSQHQMPQGADPAQTVDPAQQGADAAANDRISIPKSRFDEVNQSRREWAEYARQVEARALQMEGYIRALQQQATSTPPPQQQAAPEEPPLPDLINDPQGYALAVQERAQRLAAQQVAKAESIARQAAWANDDIRAEQRFGRETVEAAKQWVRQNGYADALSRRADPYSAAVDLFRTAQLRAAVPNGDLNHFKQQVLLEHLSNPEFVKRIAPMLLQARPGVQPPPAVTPPPLSGQPRTNAQTPQTMFSTGMDGVKAMLAARRSAFPAT